MNFQRLQDQLADLRRDHTNFSKAVARAKTALANAADRRWHLSVNAANDPSRFDELVEHASVQAAHQAVIDDLEPEVSALAIEIDKVRAKIASIPEAQRVLRPTNTPNPNVPSSTPDGRGLVHRIGAR